MRKFKFIISLTTAGWMLLAVCVFISACKEKYVPIINDINPNYLVVDGFINIGADSTIFKISRTFKLESKAVVTPERAAIVAVESDAGQSYILPELPAKPGTYAVPALNLDQSKKYRLRVRTKDNREYLSDFVESKVSPPVELTYDFRHDNLNIYSNTRDVTSKSRYYNYTYTETWQYRTKQLSEWKIENHQLIKRMFPKDDIFNCFHYASSGSINIASTVTLTEDRLADNLLVDIPSTSEKVGIEYSILVKQTVLTKDGFEFYNTLKKNTQNVGSIFDAQPSQLFGNIHCTTNPAEVIIGFISAGTVTEKRITLVANSFPFTFIGPLPDRYCDEQVDTLYISTGEVKRLLTDPTESEYITLYELTGPAGIYAYTATKERFCVDCRLQGGTTAVPPFWIH
ncbi:DUF4249 domain-containing protein [Mucilaginibacter calamicampi]|uniref:DUF4249 domain-containing protein n=1 Tax=Mucilaginibacter calamicampi TaxID=1302352 RepID=A0ABW2YUH5_9SPHI